MKPKFPERAALIGIVNGNIARNKSVDGSNFLPSQRNLRQRFFNSSTSCFLPHQPSRNASPDKVDPNYVMDTKKRSHEEACHNKKREIPELDLTLRLTPTWLHNLKNSSPTNHQTNTKANSLSMSSSSSPSSLSSDQLPLNPSNLGLSCNNGGGGGLGSNSEPNGNNIMTQNRDQEESLVLVGCKSCLMFVMVPEDDPICIHCTRNNNLVDSRGNQIYPKKSRKN